MSRILRPLARSHDSADTPHAETSRVNLFNRGRSLFLLSVVLLSVALVPAAWMPLQGLKLSLFSLGLLMSLLFLLRSGKLGESLEAPGGRAALIVALALPLTYAVSYFFSTDRSVALTGFGLETDTILMVCLLVVTFLCSFVMFQTPRSTERLLSVLTWTFAAAALFQVVVLLTGGALLPNVFEDRSVNLVGKWNDFGLIVALLAVLLIVRRNSDELLPRTLATLGGAVLLLAVVNFPAGWYLLVLAALAYMVVRRARGVAVSGFQRFVPHMVIAAALICAVFGASINAAITRMVPVSSLEVRPSLSSTMQVAYSSHDSATRTLFGSGPNTFSESWLLYKPFSVNNSLFWNLDFMVGFSTIATAFASVGLLGVAGWSFSLALLALYAWRIYRKGPKEELSATQWTDATALGLLALVSLLALWLYVPSQAVVVLTFVLAGAAVATTARLAGAPGLAQPRAVVLMASVVGIVLLAAFLFANTARATLSQMQVNRGLLALSRGETDEALRLASQARSIQESGNALRLSLDAGMVKVRAILQSDPNSPEQAELIPTLERAVEAGQKAVAKNPRDYRPFVSLASLYGMLASGGVQGAYENSRDILAAAAERNPSSPSIPLARARLEALRGDRQATADYLIQALIRKSNYTDAILLDVQLKVADEDLEGAIASAQAAALSAPSAPAVWFQLGLLHYAAQEFSDASLAFEQAVALTPTYANAKYFLGLSYYELDKNANAVAVFEDLVRTNPTNTEVPAILQNLKEGKAPFAGLSASQSGTLPDSAPIAE